MIRAGNGKSFKESIKLNKRDYRFKGKRKNSKNNYKNRGRIKIKRMFKITASQAKMMIIQKLLSIIAQR